MRASVACEKCRRSKVKCVNNGINTTCEACAKDDRPCKYLPPAPGGRRESIIAREYAPGDRPASQGETPPKKRQKRALAPTSHATPVFKEIPRPSEEALDPQVLTPKVWTELFDIFQRHYAADLPFLHSTTFLRSLQQNASRSPPTGSSNSSHLPPHSPLLLLAFLVLTSRFHDGLLSHHSARRSKQSSPYAGAEVAKYYARAARQYQHLEPDDIDSQSDSHSLLERTQALLMLGIHEWSMGAGAKAWLTVQEAISTGQLIGLEFDYDYDDMKDVHTKALDPGSDYAELTTSHRSRHQLGPDRFSVTAREIRHRTFWSCFIMDRLLSSSKRQKARFRVEDLRVPLPVSEEAFTFGKKVRTLLLGSASGVDGYGAERVAEHNGPTVPEHQSWGRTNGHGGHNRHESRISEVESPVRSEMLEAGNTEGLLSCYIRALDLFAKVKRWVDSGGRRKPGSLPPWQAESEANMLETNVQDFATRLPESFRLTDQNTDAHAHQRTSTPYILMHFALLLCTIELHSNYFPHLAFACDKPMGPIDHPVFTAKDNVPEGYFEASAAKGFGAARKLLDLLRSCDQWNRWVETPLSSYAAFKVGWLALYCIHFPKFDQHDYMGRARRDRHEILKYVLRRLTEMSQRQIIAHAWCLRLRGLNRYYYTSRKKFKESVASPESGGSSTSSFREGGGLEDYEVLEEFFNELWPMVNYNIDVQMMDAVDNKDEFEHASEAEEAIKSESHEAANGSLQEGSTPDSAYAVRPAPQEKWTSVNNTPKTDPGKEVPPATQTPQDHLGYPNMNNSAQTNQVPSHEPYRSTYGPVSMNVQHPPPMHYPSNATVSAARTSLQLQGQIDGQTSGVAHNLPQGHEAMWAHYGGDPYPQFNDITILLNASDHLPPPQAPHAGAYWASNGFTQ